eukprot:6196261-Prymnesium_polylepis.1
MRHASYARAEAVRVLLTFASGNNETKKILVTAGDLRMTHFAGEAIDDSTNITIPVRGVANANLPQLSMVDYNTENVSSGSIVYCSASHEGDQCAIRGKDGFYLFSTLIEDIKTNPNSTSLVNCSTSEGGQQLYSLRMDVGDGNLCGRMRFVVGSLQVYEEPPPPPPLPPLPPSPPSPPSSP